MKFSFKHLAICGLAAILGLGIVNMSSGGDDNKVYSKRRDLPLLEKADSTAKPVAKADWNEELSVSTREGRWLKVEAKDGEGWVYVGNVAMEKLAEENKNDMPMKSSGVTAAAASRPLSAEAEAYAGRHSLSEVAAQFDWVEKLNAGISRDDARNWLKAQKLGEYAQAP